MFSIGCALVAVLLTFCQYKVESPSHDDGRGRYRLKMLLKAFYGLALFQSVSGAAMYRRQATENINDCPGYSASDIVNTDTGLTAKLTLNGPACNVYGTDVQNLRLLVNYDSGMHTKLRRLSIVSLTRLKRNVYTSRLRMKARLPTKFQLAFFPHQMLTIQSHLAMRLSSSRWSRVPSASKSLANRIKKYFLTLPSQLLSSRSSISVYALHFRRTPISMVLESTLIPSV